MGLATLPSDWSRLAEVEQALSLDLSLVQVHKAESDLEGLIFHGSDETAPLARELFERVEAKRSSLVERELALSRQAAGAASDLLKLELTMPYLSPEEAAEAIYALKERVEALSKRAPSTHRLQEMVQGFQRGVEHLVFAFAYPVVFDLESDSFQLNIAHHLEQIAASIRGGSPSSFSTLSARQQKEVRAFVGLKATPEDLAHGIEAYRQSLLAQAFVAELYFHGKKSAEKQYKLLPREIRKRVSEIEWELNEESPQNELRVQALMASLEERMSLREPLDLLT